MSALDAAYAGITRVVADLDDLDLLLPSGCHGWSIADLLLHLTLDAQRALWTDTAPAAVRAADAADADGCVGTQGHVLVVPDFIATLVTEAVIHHLDLIVSLPGAAEPAPEAVAVALSTLDGLAAPDGLPRHWGEREALFKGAGRQDLDATDRRALGGRAELFPLLG
ncbi:MAG TPA: maleylpyruvate isomerase N-terminal domain-containing protein [Actinoplanes sp.]|nr:maleylpyruvate isomerase N-terminal domain-containing protein [Actinoplanes sp.]